MKSKIKSGLKIYLFAIIFLLVVCFCYSLYLSNTGNDLSLIAKIGIGGSTFLVLGLAYGNAIHKKGLLIGLLVALVHVLLFKAIIFLSVGSFDFNFLLLAIYTILGGIGGLMGVNIKKIF